MNPRGFATLCALTLWSATALADRPAPTHADVAYGPHQRNVLDFWQAKSESPTPVVVFIHGGGFVNGGKEKAGSAIIQRCLDHGVSYAAINYRYRTQAPIQDVLRDCGRAIQFLRSKAADWNIDKDRIAAHGGSAGAGTSLWLAFHDDLADPKNADPILRESSRIRAAGATACQATYDILRWKEILGEAAFRKYSPLSDWPGFYGLKSIDEVMSEKGKKIRADCDMLGLIKKGGSPVWLGTTSDDGEPTNRGSYIHSPKHAIAIKDRCDEVGIEAVLVRGQPAKGQPTAIDFLLAHLGAGTRGK